MNKVEVTDKDLAALINIQWSDTPTHTALLELQELRKLTSTLCTELKTEKIVALLNQCEVEAEVTLESPELHNLLHALVEAHEELAQWKQRFKPTFIPLPEALKSVEAQNTQFHPIGTAVLGEKSVDIGFAEMRNPAAVEGQPKETMMLTFINSAVTGAGSQNFDAYKIAFIAMDGMLSLVATELLG